jgi:hypothetical protein
MNWVSRYRIISTVLVLGFFTLLIGGISLLVLWFIEQPPTDIMERSVVMQNVKAGDYLQIKNVLRWTKECSVYVERMITDSDGVARNYQPADVYNIARGSQIETIVAEIHIPGSAAKGPARYNSTFVWSCNPLQRVWPRRLKLPELRFTIT